MYHWELIKKAACVLNFSVSPYNRPNNAGDLFLAVDNGHADLYEVQLFQSPYILTTDHKRFSVYNCYLVTELQQPNQGSNS